MALEFALEGHSEENPYSFRFEAKSSGPDDNSWILDWRPMLEEILTDIGSGTSSGVISLRFHNTLAKMVVAVAERCELEHVVLTGGCFQNRYLTERVIEELRGGGFQTHWHQRIPPNDGGLALGQVVAAVRESRMEQVLIDGAR